MIFWPLEVIQDRNLCRQNTQPDRLRNSRELMDCEIIKIPIIIDDG